MEDEYCKEDQYAVSADQYIFKSIVRLAKLFANEKRLKRDDVVNILSNEVINNYERAEKLASYLENYGILHLYCEHGSGLLSPNVYYYYPGIQGYFDYALSLMLIDEYKHPEKIDFKKYKKLPHNSYYVLAIISIQKFNYLITDNSSIIDVISKYFYDELLFFALRHSNLECAEEYKSFVLNLMIKNVDMLRTVLNNIILPLSRETTHPLGISLLHEFLIGFEHPAERDILWSAPDYLLESNNEKWYVSVSFNLGEDSYLLTDIDTADGLPTAFAWALSSLDNNRRQKIRIELIKWGLVVPDEFYKLFLKFSFVNDPQIKSDMFSILMSLLFESDNIELLNTASKWMIENILDPSKIDLNRDVAIRYYATSIVRKAVSMNIIEPSKASDYLPPFNLCSNHIDLSEEAMAGSYMGGYGAITYDLGRYVLVDHITANFPKNMQDGKTQYENLIESIAKEHKKLKVASATQFILSAAYKFITMCGWNEKEFYYYDSSKKKTYGIDYDIKHEYLPKTHGTQSPVMTVCEKYVWQARNYISGFFADRLMVDDIDGASFVKDYSLLDDFIIPSLEIGHTNPDGVNDLYPWHIPEKESVLISGKSNSKEDVINTIKTAPDINWEKWITLDNTHQSYPIDGDRLLALRSFSCFESISGIETNLYLNSILVDICYVEKLIDMVINDSDISNSIRNPSDWVGGVNSNCYLSPQEICWMPWKKRYNSHLADEFGEIKIDSAVDSCVYNFINQGDVSYDLPSVIIREILGIVNTDGYEFYDKDKQIKAISVHVGEKWRTQQYQLLVSDDLLEQLELRGKTLVWIMREERIKNVKATERFGEINAEKDCSYIGYFNKEEFVIKEIPIKETKKFDSSIILSELLDQLGY